MTSDWRRQSSRGRISEAQVPSKTSYLTGRSFLLEVENRQLRTKVADGIQNAGGEIIDSFDDRTPLAVISDHSMAVRLEKDNEAVKLNDRMLKVLPALLREAVKRKIKIRTPQRFLSHLANYTDKTRKASSATNSNSTMRGKPVVVKQKEQNHHHTQPEKAPKPVPQRVSSDQSSSRKGEEKAFLRIDLPGKRPEVRSVDKSTFSRLYTGKDAGFSIFKAADPQLVEKRERDYDMFLKGKYETAKKSFKLDEKDAYCQFCAKNIVGERKDHEKTDEHRQKARTLGLGPTLERIVLNARLKRDRNANMEALKEKRMKDIEELRDKARRANVEYEYGENEMTANWSLLKEMKRSPDKTPDMSTRRRQKRIRYTPCTGDN